MKNLRKILLGLTMMALVLTGCQGNDSQGKTEAGNSSSEKTVYTVIELPNDGGQMSPGIEAAIKEMNIALEPFNAEVVYQSADDYSVVSEAILSGTAHMTTASGATYVKSRMENDKIVPMFVPAPGGDLAKAGYPAYIATNIANKADFEGLEGLDAIKQLKGKSFSFVSATSTSGRVVPTTTLWETFGPDGASEITEKNKIFEGTIDDGGIFSEVQFAGSHPASVELIANNRVYAGAFCCEYGKDYADQLHIIYEQQVSGDPYWVNSEIVAQEHIDAIVDHFTSLTPENVTADNFFAPEGQTADDQNEFLINYDDRYVEVEPSYFDFLQKMFEDEM
ncbi:MAG: PhnD/SsuA/transferrin family substrate-binding protein [Bacillota bacterium]|nr:PhnD/SsuA/transferrin family substrate-binding protein [Bacillota bacterium]